jgi:hypothetical protein
MIWENVIIEFNWSIFLHLPMNESLFRQLLLLPPF